MPKGSKKQQPAKRKYTKRNTIEDPIDEQIHVSGDTEIEELALVCKVIDSWDHKQKERNLSFIYSKFSSFIKL